MRETPPFGVTRAYSDLLPEPSRLAGCDRRPRDGVRLSAQSAADATPA